jgi:aminocarboxymuconate-semialdehyde decarboxylase
MRLPETKEGFGNSASRRSTAPERLAYVGPSEKYAKLIKASIGASDVRLFSCAPAGAAQPGGAAGREVLVVDLHCHCKTAAVEPLAAPHYAVEKEPMDRFSNDRTREVNRQQGARIAPQLASVEQRIKDMDRMGVDVQAVSTSPLQFHYWTPPDVGRQITRLVNENIAGMIARHPERFVGLAHVPMQDGQMAAAELERCVKDLGFRGAEIGTNIAGVEISDSRFEPFWKMAAELGVVVFIHPHGFTDGARLSDHYFSNVIGNPLDTTVAVSHLIFDGVLDRPGLKIVTRTAAATSARIRSAWTMRMAHGRTAASRSSASRPLTSASSTSTRWCGTTRRCDTWWICGARTISSRAPTTRSTWATTTRSGSWAGRSSSSAPRRTRSSAATPRSCSGSGRTGTDARRAGSSGAPQSSSRIGFESVPMPSISISIVSPGFIHTGGLRA